MKNEIAYSVCLSNYNSSTRKINPNMMQVTLLSSHFHADHLSVENMEHPTCWISDTFVFFQLSCTTRLACISYIFYNYQVVIKTSLRGGCWLRILLDLFCLLACNSWNSIKQFFFYTVLLPNKNFMNFIFKETIILANWLVKDNSIASVTLYL